MSVYDEIIIVDNNSTDETLNISKKYTNKIYTIGPERSAQRNFGAKISCGGIYLFLDSDMKLDEGVLEQIWKAFQCKSTQAVVVPEYSYGKGFWSKCKTMEREFYINVDWMEAARGFRETAFHCAKGYDENNTGTEDYDLPNRIEAKYGKKSIGRIESKIGHDEGHLSIINSCRKKFYYGKSINIYSKVHQNQKRLSEQKNPLKRYGLYFRQPKKFFYSPIVYLGMLFLKAFEMGSGYAGYIFYFFKSMRERFNK